METKICSKCKEEKDVCEFQKDSSKKGGYYSSCRDCVRVRTKDYITKNYVKVKDGKKKYYEKNKENISKKNSDYRKLNREELIEYSKKYYVENKEKFLYGNKKRYEINKDKIKEKNKEYRKKNFKKYQSYLKKYKTDNSEKIRKYLKDYKKNKIKNDKLFYLKMILSHRVRQFLKVKNIVKKSKTFDIVGCNPLQLTEHLEKQFVSGMTWENRGEWHIDHIIPLSSAKNEDEVYKLCHYTNLQPLWAIDNIKKGKKILSNNLNKNL
jgi:hypothetical protein